MGELRELRPSRASARGSELPEGASSAVRRLVPRGSPTAVAAGDLQRAHALGGKLPRVAPFFFFLFWMQIFDITFFSDSCLVLDAKVFSSKIYSVFLKIFSFKLFHIKFFSFSL